MSEMIVAFRTHVWDHSVEELARRLLSKTIGADFVVIADETNGSLDVQPFDKISHGSNFQDFGLPAFPSSRFLWHNADYPLYVLRKNFPHHKFYALVEYDVSVNFDFLSLFSYAHNNNIDLVATHISNAQENFPWYRSLISRFCAPMRALIPIMILSARAIDHLLFRRLEICRQKIPETLDDWPFCEGFIPSSVRELGEDNLYDFAKSVACPHFWVEEPIYLHDSRCYMFNAVNHPVMGGQRFIRRCFRADNIERIFENGDYATQWLDCFHPREFVPYFMSLILLPRNHMHQEPFLMLCRKRGWEKYLQDTGSVVQ